MSVYGALYSGVSGLAANSNALGMISDNITNVNTVGYKTTKARFSTLVTEGESRTNYSAGGVQSTPQTLVSGQGLLQASSSATDLSIMGNGFFVVSGSPSDGLDSASIQFTRAGSFFPDDDGFLRNTAGLYLKGWPLDDNGQPPPNLSNLSTLETINISGLTGTAAATTSVGLGGKLQTSQVLNPLETGYTVNDMMDYVTSAGATGIKPDFLRDVQVYDSQGGAHTITMTMMKSSAADNQWHVELFDAAPGGAGAIASGELVFNPDGSLKLTGVPATSAALTAPIPGIDWNNGSALSNITFNWGSDGKADGFAQYDSTSTLASPSVNGAVFGNVIGVEITKEGTVIAQFDNGLAKPVYQLPIATFQNADGLKRATGNSYTQSDQSGNFSLQQAGTGGAGMIAPSNLEASTVDLAHEFTNLITVQRAYSASTKVITTADEMLDELNRLKR
jgi:flagellar hook protein FlgE